MKQRRQPHENQLAKAACVRRHIHMDQVRPRKGQAEPGQGQDCLQGFPGPAAVHHGPDISQVHPAVQPRPVQVVYHCGHASLDAAVRPDHDDFHRLYPFLSRISM